MTGLTIDRCINGEGPGSEASFGLGLRLISWQNCGKNRRNRAASIMLEK